MTRQIFAIAGLLGPLVIAGVAGSAAVAQAEDTARFSVTIMDDKFDPAEIHVPAGKPFILEVKNATAIAAEMESDKLRFEKIIAAGQTATIRVRAAEPGTHVFYNEFKEDVRGKVIAE